MNNKKLYLYLPKDTSDVLKLISALLVVTAHLGTVCLGPAYNSKNPIFISLLHKTDILESRFFSSCRDMGLCKASFCHIYRYAISSGKDY